MSYYKFFNNYESQSVFTSNTKFIDINSNIYNKKVEKIDQDVEDESDNNEEDTEKTEDKPLENKKMNSCNCSSCPV